jgi:hypothetical protein
MSDLIDFLRARIAEDEEAARQSADFGGRIHGSHWRLSGSHADDGGTYWSIVATAGAGSYEQVIEVVGSGMSGGGAHTEQVARHAVRHDPARVIIEAEAKRRLIDCIEDHLRRVDDFDAQMHDFAMLMTLTLPYREHADYRREWWPMG